MRPPPGGGTRIWGSTSAGGQITPFWLASRSLRLDWPLASVDERFSGVAVRASGVQLGRSGLDGAA
jgi:hypothetical protein